MKWLSWLGRLIITIVVVCLLTVVTTGYVVNYYIEHMLSRYHISMTDGGPSVSDIMKGLVGIQGSPNSGSDSTKKDNLESQQSSSLDSSTTSPQNEESSHAGNDQNNEVPLATGGANAGNGNGNGNEKSPQKENVVVTPDDLIAKKEGIEAKDKEAVFTILMSKLPQEEMQKLTEYMEDGLTETEVLAIEQMLSKYLDKTEYAKVMEILKK